METVDLEQELTSAADVELAGERYLASHRALGACTRQFARLADEIAAELTAIRLDDAPSIPEQRRQPDRCVLQLADAAVTLSWLRTTKDTVADGRLLVIAWRGTVVTKSSRMPERSLQPMVVRADPAVAVWEETFLANATSEADWRWRREGDTSGGLDATALARRCGEFVRGVLVERGTIPTINKGAA